MAFWAAAGAVMGKVAETAEVAEAAVSKTVETVAETAVKASDCLPQNLTVFSDLSKSLLDRINPFSSIDNPLFSKLEDRIRHTPREGNDGKWSGGELLRGNSKWIPSDAKLKERLAKYGQDGIDFKNGVADFSKVSEQTVDIDGMTIDRLKNNFPKADAKCAEAWNKEMRDGRNNWTADQVKQYRHENTLSWHERSDMKHCDLVSKDIHQNVGHTGGVYECKLRDGVDVRSKFDV